MKIIKRDSLIKEIKDYKLAEYEEDFLTIYDCWTYQKECENLKSKIAILLEKIFQHPMNENITIPLSFITSTLGTFLLGVYVDAPKELSINDLAEIIGCSRQNLYNHISKGNLKISKIGNENYITQLEAERFIKKYK